MNKHLGAAVSRPTAPKVASGKECSTENWDHLSIATIAALVGDRLGTHDVPCPVCGPFKSRKGQRREVMRVWYLEPGFASYHCARCGEKGYAADRRAQYPDPQKIAKLKAEAAARDCAHTQDRLAVARWLWSQRQPLVRSVAEIYLREVRGIRKCVLPATLASLPPRGEHGPAMIAAFGLAYETEPGVLKIRDDDVYGVHLTRLGLDGRKLGTDRDKIMIGHSAGSPIVVAPPNDLLGLAISEGIEDALSIHAATGLGAWAAGCASRLPALADAVPHHIECVTISVDDDKDGLRHAEELASRLDKRGITVEPIVWGRVG